MDRSLNEYPIKICLVDEHPLLLAGVTKIVEEYEEFELVGAGSTSSDIFDLCSASNPDVLITDMELRGSVQEAIARVVTSDMQTRILILSAAVDVENAISVLEAGAVGYVVKTAPVADFFEAIRKVHAGETYITPGFAARIVARLREVSKGNRSGVPELSVREIQVLRLLLNGKQNKEIAGALDISEKTVKHYMTVLMQKFNARNRTEVVLAAQALQI